MLLGTMTETLDGRWAVVTGASSGFGVEFAKLLAARNANLVLVARHMEPMAALAEDLRRRHSVQVVVEGMDLSERGCGAELASRLDARGLVVDVLVNNAGYGIYGPFIEQPLDKVTNMLELNVIALTELTYVFAREMVRRRRGHILLTASMLGFQAVPGYAAYAATKGYVLLFAEALHRELKPHGVAVTALCPGPAATPFVGTAGQRRSFMLDRMMLQPAAVAKAGVRAMLRRRATVVPGFMSRAVVFLDRLMPRAMQRATLARALGG